jgi:hypothetical protein
MSKSLTQRPTGGFPTIAGHTFVEHREFEASVGRAVVGGGLGAVVASQIAAVASLADPITLLVQLSVAGALALVGARSGGVGAGRGAIFGLLGGLLYASNAAEWPLFGALLLGAAAAPVLAPDASLPKKGVTAVFAGLLMFAGIFVTTVLESRGVLVGLVPDVLAAAAAGGAAGLFLGLGAAPRHVALAEDPVEAAYNRTLGSTQGELYEILDRALGIYQAVRADLLREPGTEAVQQIEPKVANMALQILEIAERCQLIERELAAAPSEELEGRIADLRGRMEAASDPGARSTLRSAVESLEGQRTAREAIVRGSERVVARLHANVALLEKVRFSLVHLRSADAERAGSEIRPLKDALEELGRELDVTAQAVGEVYGASDHEIPIAPRALPARVDAPVVQVESTIASTPEPEPEETSPEATPPSVSDPAS